MPGIQLGLVVAACIERHVFRHRDLPVDRRFSTVVAVWPSGRAATSGESLKAIRTTTIWSQLRFADCREDTRGASGLPSSGEVSESGNHSTRTAGFMRAGLDLVVGCGPLGPVLDAAKHFLAHHEADCFGGLDKQPGPRPCVRISLTNQQPRGVVGLVSERERPCEVVWRRDVSDRDPASEDE